MSWTLVLPAIAVVGIGFCAGLIQRRLRPSHAALVLSGLAVVAAVAVAGALALVAFGFVVQQRWAADIAGWCRRLYGSHRVPAWQGLLATTALVAMAASWYRAYRARRAVIERHPRLAPLDVVPTDEPIAYSVPGTPGHIVVSTGMLRCLDAGERRVLLAHERSHVEHRHDRYVAGAELAAAAVPILRPLAAHVRFATERWADEDAADVVGDRRLVATAIVRAALAQADWRPQPAFALAGLGVAARVEALLDDGRAPVLVAEAAATAGGAALLVSVGTSALQVHHLLAFAAHICRI